MSQSFRLKRFSNIAILKRIDFTLLLEFLKSSSKFTNFLAQHGLSLTQDSDLFDFDKLSRILMSPDTETPEEFLDALFFVDNLSAQVFYDRLLAECNKAGIDLGIKDPTPEDLTLRIWLADPDILERVHAEQNMAHPSKFESFISVYSDRPEFHFSADVREALETDLNDWYAFKKKGRGAKVFLFPGKDNFWFLVRHGQRLKRESTVKADESSGSVFYRPEKFDVLIYYPEKGELEIYTDTKGEQKNYCKQFGKHIFNDEGFFLSGISVAKYTLQPLIDDQRDALTCSDILGIENIRLYELHIQHASDQKNIEIRRADDVFQALEEQQRNLESEQEHASLIQAKFNITFTGGRERSVRIALPNIGAFDRETDSPMIHDWLTKRGFINTFDTEVEEYGEPKPVLAMA